MPSNRPDDLLTDILGSLANSLPEDARFINLNGSRSEEPLDPFRFANPLEAFDSLLKDLGDHLAEGDPADSGDAADVDSATPHEPNVSVATTDEDVVVTVDLPGISLDNVTVMVVGETLLVDGARPKVDEALTVEYDGVQRGRVFAEVELPTTVTKDQVSASLKDGVLTVSIARATAALEPFEVAVS